MRDLLLSLFSNPHPEVETTIGTVRLWVSLASLGLLVWAASSAAPPLHLGGSSPDGGGRGPGVPPTDYTSVVAPFDPGRPTSEALANDLRGDLLGLGYGPLPADGIDGSSTRGAVRRLLGSLGMAPRGVVSPAALIAATALKEPALAPGETGSAVRILQLLLQKDGFNPGPPLGRFDASTARALAIFQASRSLPASGVADALTWVALLVPPSGTPSASGEGAGPSAGTRPRLSGVSTRPLSGSTSEVAGAGGYEVLGYWLQPSGSGSPASYRAHAAAVSDISPLWYSVRANGSVKEWWPAAVAGAVSEAHLHGSRVLALVNNMGATDAMLKSPGLMRLAVESLVRIALRNHLDGYNIDFEGLNGQDALGLVRFMQELRTRLQPLGLETTVAVGPRASSILPADDPSSAYDYPSLARTVDRMVIMTYDQHDDGSAPGPIAGRRWVARVLDYALGVGVPPKKILLGIADYGYDWSSGVGQSITAADALRLARTVGAPIRWDPVAEESHFTYWDASGQRHDVWFEDGRSLQPKLALVTENGLAGVALWVLGSEGPSTFPTLERALGSILP